VPTPFRLRDLGLAVRLGLSCVVLVLLGGMAASFVHLVWHHQNRDERPGLSMTDIKGVYHGVLSRSPLAVSLEAGHPEALPAPARDALLDWLLGRRRPDGTRPPEGNPRLGDDYDSPDLGDLAPAELLGTHCLKCHARGATEGGGIGRRVPLEFFDDVRRLAFSREISPMSLEILATTTHTHALSLGVLALAVGALLCVTSWPRALVGGLALLTGLGLLLDLASWWLARGRVEFAYVVAGAGGVFNAGLVLMMLAVLADLWLPRRRA
jgi:hypothetical protein